MLRFCFRIDHQKFVVVVVVKSRLLDGNVCTGLMGQLEGIRGREVLLTARGCGLGQVVRSCCDAAAVIRRTLDGFVL
jgi:hypothetical protein